MNYRMVVNPEGGNYLMEVHDTLQGRVNRAVAEAGGAAFDPSGLGSCQLAPSPAELLHMIEALTYRVAYMERMLARPLLDVIPAVHTPLANTGVR